MTRQCAWCLRLMNHLGERISLQPVPKVYDATHGMCLICGMHWLERAMVETGEWSTLVPALVAKEINYRC